MSFIRSPKPKSKELFEYNKEDCDKIPEDLVLNLVRTLSNLSDHNKPYLDELNYSQQSESFYSLDSSLFNDEISIINEVSDIKLKMSEMKMIAKDSIKSFKMTSKEFLAQSILESEKRTLLLDELENLKTTLVERIREGNDAAVADVTFKDMCEQVHDVQAQIKACIEGDDQERLAAKLRDLDCSLELIVCEKENRSDGCQCFIC